MLTRQRGSSRQRPPISRSTSRRTARPAGAAVEVLGLAWGDSTCKVHCILGMSVCMTLDVYHNSTSMIKSIWK